MKAANQPSVTIFRQTVSKPGPGIPKLNSRLKERRSNPSVGQGFSRLVRLHLRNIFGRHGRAFEAYFFLEISLVPRAICRRSTEKRFPIPPRAPQMATRPSPSPRSGNPRRASRRISCSRSPPLPSSRQENCNVASKKSQPLDPSGGARQFSPSSDYGFVKREGRKIFKDIRDGGGVLSYVFIARVYGSGRALSRPRDEKETASFFSKMIFNSLTNRGFTPSANNTCIVVQYRCVSSN